MNLRLSSNQIRLRIRKDEAGILQTAGHLFESICFAGGAQLNFEVKVTKSESQSKEPITAKFGDQRLTVEISSKALEVFLTGPLKKDSCLSNEAARGECEVIFEVDVLS